MFYLMRRFSDSKQKLTLIPLEWTILTAGSITQLGTRVSQKS